MFVNKSCQPIFSRCKDSGQWSNFIFSPHVLNWSVTWYVPSTTQFLEGVIKLNDLCMRQMCVCVWRKKRVDILDGKVSLGLKVSLQHEHQQHAITVKRKQPTATFTLEWERRDLRLAVKVKKWKWKSENKLEACGEEKGVGNCCILFILSATCKCLPICLSGKTGFFGMWEKF